MTGRRSGSVEGGENPEEESAEEESGEEEDVDQLIRETEDEIHGPYG